MHGFGGARSDASNLEAIRNRASHLHTTLGRFLDAPP